jgi:hypothetical protein
MTSLYLSESEIARLVLGAKRVSEWRGIAAILERDGFPKVDPLFGGRYAPAVRAWLDAYNRVANITPPRRGREKWPEVERPDSSGGSGKTENVLPIGMRDRT